MVLQGYFPPDIRVEKEARTLVKAGHKVLVLSLNKGDMPDKESINGVKVLRWREPRDPLRRLWNSLCSLVFFVYPYWERILMETVKQCGIEAIHVHDLPLAKTGFIVASRFNIPLVADLHENYVEAMKIWTKQGRWKGAVGRILIPSGRWDRLQKLCFKQAYRVVAVIDEAKHYYVQKYGVRPEKVEVVMNAEDLEFFDRIGIDKRIYDTYKSNFTISYIGGFEQLRGIDTVIKAMPEILKQIPNALLLLVGGKGSEGYEEDLRELCKKLNIEKNVVFAGWVAFQHIPSYIAVSDVCLVPHIASQFTDTTIPHKLFQYMAMKKPVVATDVKPIRRILEGTKSGIVIPSGDYKRMAEAIIRLYDHKEYAEELGINGRKAVETKYNWETESKKLCRLYDELERRNHGRS